MNRLTFEGNFCDIAMCRETPGGSFCEDGYCSQRKVWERLKAYEDTGLEPETVEAVRDIILRDGGIERLLEICKAEKEGRLRIEEKRIKCPKCGKYRLTQRLDQKFYYCFNCKTQFSCKEIEEV